MTVARARGSKAKADRLFSQIVKARADHRCENCGSAENQLQTAHIISRRYNATRCDLDNALALCAGCHRYFTDMPVSFGDFVHAMWPGRWPLLYGRWKANAPVDWNTVVVELERELAAMT